MKTRNLAASQNTLPSKKTLIDSDRFCAPDKLHLDKCPKFILDYKDCCKIPGSAACEAATPTFFAAKEPGYDKENLTKLCWNGKWYERTFKYESRNGFVEEFYDGEHCYMGSLNVPGTSLMSNRTLGIFFMIFLFRLFLGISVIADIFMEAIEVITSTTKDV